MTTPTPAPTIAPPLTAEAEQRIRDSIALGDCLFTEITVRSLLASLDEARKDSKRLDEVEKQGLMIWCEHSMNAEKNTSEFIWSARHSGPKKTAREAIDQALSKKGSQ